MSIIKISYKQKRLALNNENQESFFDSLINTPFETKKWDYKTRKHIKDFLFVCLYCGQWKDIDYEKELFENNIYNESYRPKNTINARDGVGKCFRCFAKNITSTVLPAEEVAKVLKTFKNQEDAATPRTNLYPSKPQVYNFEKENAHAIEEDRKRREEEYKEKIEYSRLIRDDFLKSPIFSDMDYSPEAYKQREKETTIKKEKLRLEAEQQEKEKQLRLKREEFLKKILLNRQRLQTQAPGTPYAQSPEAIEEKRRLRRERKIRSEELILKREKEEQERQKLERQKLEAQRQKLEAQRQKKQERYRELHPKKQPKEKVTPVKKEKVTPVETYYRRKIEEERIRQYNQNNLDKQLEENKQIILRNQEYLDSLKKSSTNSNKKFGVGWYRTKLWSTKQ